jgi:acyl dehydratase
MSSTPADALGGCRVVELGYSLTGAFAARLLGDLGADVVKVEDGADPDPTRDAGPRIRAGSPSALFERLNWNKRSLAVDMTEREERQPANRVVAAADIVIASFGPEDAAGRGVEALLCAADPGSVVVIAISGEAGREPLRHGGRTRHDRQPVSLRGHPGTDGTVRPHAAGDRRDRIWDRGRPAAPARADDDDRPMTGQARTPGRSFETVAVGDKLTPFICGPLTTLHLMRFSAAIENWRRIHYDQQFATGLEGCPICSSAALSSSISSRMLRSWAGPGAWLVSMGTQFRAMNRVGETLTVCGVVTGLQRRDDGALGVMRAWDPQRHGYREQSRGRRGSLCRRTTPGRCRAAGRRPIPTGARGPA